MDQKVTQLKPYKMIISLKDFEGKVVREMHLDAPLPFPYLVYNKKLFVVSRDEPLVMIERSYCVLFDEQAAAGDSH